MELSKRLTNYDICSCVPIFLTIPQRDSSLYPQPGNVLSKSVDKNRYILSLTLCWIIHHIYIITSCYSIIDYGHLVYLLLQCKLSIKNLCQGLVFVKLDQQVTLGVYECLIVVHQKTEKEEFRIKFHFDDMYLLFSISLHFEDMQT